MLVTSPCLSGAVDNLPGGILAMRKINWGRVFMGGTVAGVVLLVLAALATVVFVGSQPLRTALHGLQPSTGGAGAPLFFVGTFLVLGMLVTWWYAAIRPLLGPGPKTAAIAGLAVWVTIVWLGVAGFALKGLAMGEPYWLPSGPGLPILFLVIIVASTMAGAWVYREQQSSPGR